MNFVDWCSQVLTELISLSRKFSSVGVSDSDIATRLFSKSVQSNNYFGSSHRTALHSAIMELIKIGFATMKSDGNLIRALPTQSGKDFLLNPTLFWEGICLTSLDLEQQRCLELANDFSQQSLDKHCTLAWETSSALPPSFSGNFNLLFAVVRELEEIGMLVRRGGLGAKFDFCATYKGLVWQTKRGFTLESKFIDQLVSEWETTSVDFKRELYLDTDSQKAEFVKDVLSLANTQASGKRWMIIGFDDKTRKYHSAPDQKITQNRLEQILACYTSPAVNIRYEVVEYRLGTVGKLEVLREPAKLPYSVSKNIGGKKKITLGQVFVRHGSQVENPTPDELIALQGERDFSLAR